MPSENGSHGIIGDMLRPIPFRGETCDECIFEAWERMTYGGLYVTLLPKRIEPVDPWGIDRFREPTPLGGLRLLAWSDR